MEQSNSFVTTLLNTSASKATVYCKESYDEGVVLPLVCGLLNGDGGWIVIGANAKREVQEIVTEGLISRIQSDVVSTINPLPLVYAAEEDAEGKPVVLITVIKGVLSPYTYRDKCYIIRDGEAVIPSANEMNWMLRNDRGTKISWELSPCVAAEEEQIDFARIRKVMEHGQANKRLRESLDTPEMFLSNLSLTVESWYTQGCVALFGNDASWLLPQCKARIQVMLTGKGSDMYDDTLTISGNAFEVQEGISQYFAKRLPMLSYFSQTEWDRKDKLLYPADVIDEAVTNAIIHRDYSDVFGEITIFIFKDRLVISNSGQMPESVLSGKSKVLPHQSISRNPQMTEVFFVDGKMERTGRGLGLIVSKMKEQGARLPEWTSKDGYTTLTIYRNAKEAKLNQRIREFLEPRALGSEFTKTEYMEVYADISKITAQTDIQTMQLLELCKKRGDGPKTRYVYVKKVTDIDR